METLKIRSFTHYLRKKRFSDPLSNSRCDTRPDIACNWRLQFIVLQSRWTVALGTVTFCKIHSSRVISIGEGKYHKKTIWLILFGVQLLRISTDQTTSSPEMRKWFPLIHSPWSSWRRTLIEELRQPLGAFATRYVCRWVVVSVLVN